MVTLRCTRKLLNLLGIVPEQTPQPPSGALGDWYANLVPTAAGGLIIFVNERSLLTVAVPEWEAENLVPWFCLRVANLLGMIGISAKSVSREMKHLDHVQFARTASRRILGSLNDISQKLRSLGGCGGLGGRSPPNPPQPPKLRKSSRFELSVASGGG